MDVRSITLLSALWSLGLAITPVQAQQSQAGLHLYLVQAQLTTAGVKNLQKQPPTALRAGVAKFVRSVGGKLEAWYYDYADSTAYAIVGYLDEISAATANLSTNSTGFAHVRLRPLMTAEDADKALSKIPAARAPQQQ
jgi:uncharacterized protein with GYD domain